MLLFYETPPSWTFFALYRAFVSLPYLRCHQPIDKTCPSTATPNFNSARFRVSRFQSSQRKLIRGHGPCLLHPPLVFCRTTEATVINTYSANLWSDQQGERMSPYRSEEAIQLTKPQKTTSYLIHSEAEEGQ